MAKSKKPVLIEQPKTRSFESTMRSAAAPLAAAGVIGVGTVGYYTGVLPELLNTQVTPEVPVIDGAVDAMVAVNETLRVTAPVVVLGMLGASAYYSVAGRFNSKQKAINHLSKTEYSGVGDIARSQADKMLGRSYSRMKKIAGVLGVLSATLVMANSGLEKDVTEGSLRPIYALTDEVSDGNGQLHLILQSKNNTFMDDSVISVDTMSNFAEDAAKEDITVVPFSKELMNINDTSAIQIALPDDMFASIADKSVDQSCDTIPVIIDETLSAEEGQDVTINGQAAQVVDVRSNLAQMNRSVAILSDSDMRCLKSDADASYFGALALGGSTQDIEAIIGSNSDMTAVTEERFYENNRDFWRANGTPVILILMGSIAVFGAAAMASKRESDLLHDIREIGTLNASGVSMKDIRRAESRRALRSSFNEALVAAPLAIGFVSAFNAAVSGLNVGVGPREVAVGAAINWASKEIAARKSISGLAKQIDLTQAVK